MRTLTILVLFSLLSLGAAAADRALIVGVGINKDPKITDLINSGIPEDVEMYTDIAQMMGIPRGSIRVLRDEQATAENIKSGIRNWLQQGVISGDRVMFAYSGHGSYVRDTSGDEKDGRDEALVPHDATRRNGEAVNMLWDDELRSLLAAVPTDDLYVFIDACHSGSITRSWWGDNEMGIGEVQGRHYQMPPGIRRPASTQHRSMEQLDVPYLAFLAAQDDQSSYGSSQGGIFTLSIYKQFKEMASGGQARTPVQMMQRSKDEISRWAGNSDKLFEPNVVGPAQKLSRPFRIDDRQGSGHGPLWQRLETLVAGGDGALDLRLNQSRFKVGDYLNIATLLPSGGYLNIVSVDAKDNATVLYPNASHPDNKVQPGALTLPSPDMQFGLMAGEPVGPSLVVAILSEKPINLHKSGYGERGNDVTQPYRSLSMSGLRAFTVSPSQPAQPVGEGYRASKVITQVSY